MACVFDAFDCSSGLAAAGPFAYACPLDKPLGSVSSFATSLRCFDTVANCMQAPNSCNSTDPSFACKSVSGSTVGVCPSDRPFFCPGDAPLGSALTIGGICYSSAAACAEGPNSCAAIGLACVPSSNCPAAFAFTCRAPSASKNREYLVSATLGISAPPSVVRNNDQGFRESIALWLGATPPVVSLAGVADAAGGAAAVDFSVKTVSGAAAAAMQAAIRRVASDPAQLRANLSWARAFPRSVGLSLIGDAVVTPPRVPPPPSTWRELVDYVDQSFSRDVTVVADLEVVGAPLIIGPGKSLRIIGNCPSPANASGGGRCRIDGRRAGNIIVVSTAGTLVLENLALVNGLCDDVTCTTFASSGGGALWAGGESSLTLRNCVLANSSASASGGAIFSLGSLTITDSALLSNSATSGGGGAVYVAGQLVANSTLFQGNSAALRGGAVESGRGNASFYNVTFVENRALRGEGGAVFAAGPVSADSVTVTSNLAATDGGGFFLNGPLAMLSSTPGVAPKTAFVGNRVIGSRAGALFANSSTARVEIADSVFQANQAYYIGGGLYLATPNVALRRVQCVGNAVRGAFPYAGGVAAEVLAAGTMTIEDTLFDGNVVAQTSGVEAASSKAFATDAVNLLGQLKGGGLYVVSPPDVNFRVAILRSRFARNRADSGSFIAAPGSGDIFFDVRDSEFVGNVAADGGGAYLGDNVTSTWSGCTFEANEADSGAALHLNGTLSSARVTESVFARNEAAQGAVASVSQSHALAMSKCNVTGNTAFGGAVFHVEEPTPGLALTQLLNVSSLALSGNTAAAGWFLFLHEARDDLPQCADCAVAASNAATSGPYPVGTLPATYVVSAPEGVKSGGYLLLSVKMFDLFNNHVQGWDDISVTARSTRSVQTVVDGENVTKGVESVTGSFNNRTYALGSTTFTLLRLGGRVGNTVCVNATVASSTLPNITAARSGAAVAAPFCDFGASVRITQCTPSEVVSTSVDGIDSCVCAPGFVFQLGTFEQRQVDFNAGSCQPCPEGFFAHDAGAESCTACPEGRLSNGTWCNPCPAGATWCGDDWVDLCCARPARMFSSRSQL